MAWKCQYSIGTNFSNMDSAKTLQFSGTSPLLLVLHMHAILSSVKRVVVFTSHVFLLFRHHGTASINGSGNGVGP
jgi:hypothetical protein